MSKHDENQGGARPSPPSSPVGDGEAPAEIWANPERGTCRAVGSGVWASDTLYVRADLAASRPPEPAASGPEADVRSVPDETKRLRDALVAARTELEEAADKFWISHCNHPGGVGRLGLGKQHGDEDRAILATLATRMTLAANAVSAAIASSPAPESGREGKLRKPDTAPKDGTPFLAWCPIIPGPGDTDVTPDGEWRVVWWETRGQFTSDRDLGPEVFTEWLPLPARASLTPEGK